VLAVSGNVWGDTTLGRGTLRTDAPNALPAATKLKIGLNYAAGGTLDLNGFDQTVAQLLHNTATAAVRTVTSPAPATLTVNQSVATDFDGRFTGAVRLVKAGSGALTLSATNTTSAGGMTVSNGTLAVAAATGLGAGPVVLAGGTLRNAQTNAALQLAALAWHAAGTFSLTLRSDGGLCGAAVAGALERGTGSAFYFDFGGSGLPGRTFALLTFGSTTFAAADFRCRNLGAGPNAGLRGRFLLEGDTLYMQAYVPVATVLTVR
jgi:autotransporter-associated beta strand protein